MPEDLNSIHSSRHYSSQGTEISNEHPDEQSFPWLHFLVFVNLNMLLINDTDTQTWLKICLTNIFELKTRHSKRFYFNLI